MDVTRSELSGIPVFWADSSLPFVASIVVRMGRVDETLPSAGMSHLLEHLVLATEWPVEEFNATVSPLHTHFWFQGDRNASLDRLRATLCSMQAPPLGRLGRERSILRTEAFGRGRGHAAVHAALRFGPRGVGLWDYPEHGLARATRVDVAAWALRYFTRRNIALTLTEPPPDELDVAMRDGARVAPPVTPPIAYLEYPSSYVHGPEGVAGASMLVQRSYEIVVAHEVIEDRLRQWLRHQEGVTYHVGSSYEPLDAGSAHLVVWADCRPASAALVRNAIVAVIDDLALNGPTDEELALSLERLRRHAHDPSSVYERVFYAAAQHLLDDEAETLEQLVVARAAVTRAGVARAVGAGFETLIVVAPDGTSQLGGRFRGYPTEPPLSIGGRSFEPVDKERLSGLTIGDEGVAVTHAGGGRSAVAYDDAVAFLTWDDGSTALYSSDGFYVVVDPAEWKKGDKAAALVRERVDPARAIDVSADPPSFEDDALLAADAAFAREEWRAAVDLFEDGLTREGDSADAWAKLAWAYMQIDQPSSAIAAARRAAELDPDDTWSPRFVARQLLRAGNRYDAAAAIEEAIRRAPVDLDTLALAADILSKASRFDEAVQLGWRAAELFPDDSRAWFAYGWAARFASEWEPAEVALRRAVELDPEGSMWHNNLGVLLLDIGRYKEALAAFDRALELDDANEFAPSNRIRALHLLGRRDEAARLFERRMRERVDEAARLVALAPGDAVTIERLARRLLAAERYEDAAARALEAVTIEPAADRHLLLAETCDWLDDDPASRAAVAAGLELAPDHVGLLEERAYHAAVDGEEAAAVAAARRIEELEGPRAALSAKGFAEIAQGSWGAAERSFDEQLRLRPMSCCALAWRGIARLGQGRRDDAATDAEGVLALNPWACVSERRLRRLLDGNHGPGTMLADADHRRLA